MIANHLLPFTKRHDGSNRFSLPEVRKVASRERLITKDFLNLAVTNQTAFSKCVEAFTPKSLELSIGWKRSDGYPYGANRDNDKVEVGDDVDEVCRRMASPFSSKVE